MKTYLPLILFFTIINYTSFAQNKPLNNWKGEKLRGKVKSVKEYSYPDGKKENKITKYSLMIYNKDGYMTEKSKYINDTMDEKTVFFCNRWGKVTERDEYYKGDYVKNQSYYSFDDKGNCIKTDNNDGNDNILSQSFYKYDDKENLIEQIDTNRKYGEQIRTMEYDAKGNMIKLSLFTGGEWYNYEIYQYDERGNRIDIKIYITKDNSLDGHYSYKYDKDNNLIEYVYYGTFTDGKEVETFQYDKYGNEISDVKISTGDDKPSKELTTTYKYDASGNWIQMTLHKKNKPDIIFERVIEYY